MRALPLLLLLVCANLALGGSVQPLAALPNAAIASAVRVDSSGNIYVAGQYPVSPQDSGSPYRAFAGKLSPDGSQVIWWTTFAGSSDERALAMALSSDNSVYIAGTTSSPDFPTTAGSLQPTTSVSSQAFAAKLSPAGAVVYSTYIGGSAGTSGAAIAVDSAGDAFITGSLGGGGVFPTTPGAVVGATTANYYSAYLVELNPTGSKALVAISGFGGNVIAVDPQGNIYAAGSFAGSNNNSVVAPTTPGAFQSSGFNNTCEALGLFGDIPCTYQHVAKIDPTGTQLIFATYISGIDGAVPTGIAVDADGNVILAGNTNSPDYPTTPGAYQPEYFANPQEEALADDFVVPPQAGYVTKLNASGTALLWSTFLAGSAGTRAGGFELGDTIAGVAIDAAGNILVTGLAYSTDFPGLWQTPVASRPTYAHPLNFVTRLSPDGSTLSPTQLSTSSSGLGGIAVRADGSVLFASPLAIVNLSTVGRVAAISDTADNAKIVSIAPGQLLTLYGTNLAPAQSASGSNGVIVTFNGIAAPILYTSGIQINVQVPYEIAGLSQVTMQVSSQSVTPAVSESYILAVVERQPSVFLLPAEFSQPIFDLTTCTGQSVMINSAPSPNIPGLQPLALNADGTLNSCANPAPPGSTVTIFLNGMGVTSPAQSTGVVNSSLTAISPSAQPTDPRVAPTILSTDTLPGSISSLAQVQLQVSGSSLGNFFLEVQQTGESPFLVRGPGILIWVKPPN